MLILSEAGGALVEEVEESGVREEWESGRTGDTRGKLACNAPSHRRLPLLRHCDDLKLLRVREEVDPAVLRPRVLHRSQQLEVLVQPLTHELL